MSSIADMVARLIASGTPPEIAAVVVTEAFAAGVLSAGIPRNSVDETAERRRAKDRDRKRLSAENLRNSMETPQNSNPPLTLSSFPSTNTEVEKRGKKVRARKPISAPLPTDWQPKPAHFEAASKRQISQAAVLEKAEDMRLWAKSKGEFKADWDATFHGFLRRDAPRFTTANGGAPRPGSKEDTRERTVNALRRLNPFADADDNRSGEGDGPPLPRQLPFVKPS